MRSETYGGLPIRGRRTGRGRGMLCGCKKLTIQRRQT
jgi:hypothetical protein